MPGYMDPLAVCEKPAVFCGVMAPESQIAFGVPHFVVGVLDQDILEGQLFSVGEIRVGAIGGAGQVLVPVVEPRAAVVDKIAVGNGIGGRHVNLVCGDCVVVL